MCNRSGANEVVAVVAGRLCDCAGSCAGGCAVALPAGDRGINDATSRRADAAMDGMLHDVMDVLMDGVAARHGVSVATAGFEGCSSESTGSESTSSFMGSAFMVVPPKRYGAGLPAVHASTGFATVTPLPARPRARAGPRQRAADTRRSPLPLPERICGAGSFGCVFSLPHNLVLKAFCPDRDAADEVSVMQELCRVDPDGLLHVPTLINRRPLLDMYPPAKVADIQQRCCKHTDSSVSAHMITQGLVMPDGGLSLRQRCNVRWIRADGDVFANGVVALTLALAELSQSPLFLTAANSTKTRASILHLDIKASNVVCGKGVSGSEWRLVDWAIAQLLPADFIACLLAGNCLRIGGTSAYFYPPELALFAFPSIMNGTASRDFIRGAGKRCMAARRLFWAEQRCIGDEAADAAACEELWAQVWEAAGRPVPAVLYASMCATTDLFMLGCMVRGERRRQAARAQCSCGHEPAWLTRLTAPRPADRFERPGAALAAMLAYVDGAWHIRTGARACRLEPALAARWEAFRAARRG